MPRVAVKVAVFRSSVVLESSVAYPTMPPTGVVLADTLVLEMDVMVPYRDIVSIVPPDMLPTTPPVA
jgi:hypothetical protein